MKTAIIIAGATRQVNLTHRFWDKLPQGDLYYSSWDLSQYPYYTKLFDVRDNIKQITDKVNFKEIFISSYTEECLQTKMRLFLRPFYLLRKVYEKIKDQGYERVIYFRPDIKLFYLDNYNAELDFKIGPNMIKILGDHHEPEIFCNHENKVMNDLFFVFPWHLFELFINNAEFICGKEIHTSLYEFFKLWQIPVYPIVNMRCVILRDNINETNIDLDQFKLTELFLEEFIRTKNSRKYFTAAELILESKSETTVKKEIDFEYLKNSQENNGILKLREK